MADVSVVIPCYNAHHFIGPTLDSVINQTDPPREVIVVDDGSTDDSAAIVEGYVRRHPNLITLIRQANAGESTARNVAIERSQGGYIAFLDSDDLWLPAKLERQMAGFAQWPDAVGLHTRVFNFRETIDDSQQAETEGTKDDPTVDDLMDYHYICPSSAIIRKAAFDDGLQFDAAVRHAEDMLFFADARLMGSLRLVDEPLVAKRVHAGQQSRNPWHTIYSLESRLNWCRSRAAKLGHVASQNIEARLADKLIRHLEDRYWRRELKDLDAMRQYAARLCPQAWSKCDLARRRLWPRWVYRLRDLFAK